MKLVTAKEMRMLEQIAIQDYGMPSILLMEHAGKRLAAKCMELMDQTQCRQTVWIFVGKGNNGGDGLVAARHLINNKRRVRVVLLSDPWDFQGDAKTNYAMLQQLRPEVVLNRDEIHISDLKKALHDQDLAIDAIYGTGFEGTAMGLDAEVIRLLMNHPGIVVSADLPSGMEGDSGEIKGPCVCADFTLTFGLPKVGLYRDPNHENCGVIEVVDIGLPIDLFDLPNLTVELIEANRLAKHLPLRRRDSHKGTYGHVFVVGGSKGMSGAVALASQAALATGSGLVTAGVPASLHDVMEVKLTEAMTKALPEVQPGIFSQAAADSILEFASKASSLVIGPGMGCDRRTKELLCEILPQIGISKVIDADGLNAVADILKEEPDFISALPGNTVITPHPGEMARLCGLTIDEIEQNRIGTAVKFAKAWQTVLVLKGAYTVVATPEGYAGINTSGNAGMATGGTGDVLAGMIGSLLGQGLDAKAAATLGVALHGMAGDFAAEKGLEGVCASNLLENIPRAFQLMRKQS